jgi:NAD(P) transhydrogenase
MAVIGTGPAGQKAAIQAAKLGRSVVAVEQRPSVGGGALTTGTIPSKTLREAVLYLTGFRQRGLYGVGYRVKDHITIRDLTYQVEHVLRSETAVVENQLSRNNVELVTGRASFVDAHTLDIEKDGETERLTADFTVIAVGSEPAGDPNVPIDGKLTFDTECILNIGSVPGTMVIAGAGVIGVEYACIFSALGARVTVIDRRDRILEFADREIVDALMFHMRDRRVAFRLGETISSVELGNGCVAVSTDRGKRIVADYLLHVAGRVGATHGLSLEAVGVETDDRGRVKVDHEYRTAVPNIFAAGDVIGFPSLAATSAEQGRLAARTAFEAPPEVEPGPVPYGIYTVPEISMVGQTEGELTEKSVPYEVGVARYAETARGQISGDVTGRLKMIVHAETRRVLGVHIIGEGATELVHIGQMLVRFNAVLDDVVDNVFNYPTLAECYKIAALDAFNRLAQGRRMGVKEAEIKRVQAQAEARKERKSRKAA